MDTRRNAGIDMDTTQCRNLIYESLMRDGAIDTLKAHLSDILRIAGWNKVVQDSCAEYVRKREGLENVNIVQMSSEMVTFGKEQIPPFVRESVKDLLRSIAQNYVQTEDSPLVPKMNCPSKKASPLDQQVPQKVPVEIPQRSVFTEVIALKTDRVQETDVDPSRRDSDQRIRTKHSVQTTSKPHSASAVPVTTKIEKKVLSQNRVNPDRAKEKMKTEKEKVEQLERTLKEKQRREGDMIRQKLEKQRHERVAQKKQPTPKVEQKPIVHQPRLRPTLSVPPPSSSASTPKSGPIRQKMSNSLAERAWMKFGPGKPSPKKMGQTHPPNLASTLVTAAAAAMAARKSHIIMASDDENSDEDEEELMDI